MTLSERLTEDWQTLALFALTLFVLWVTAFVPGAANNTLWRTLAQAIVITGLVGMALAKHYHELAVKNEEIKRLIAESDGLRRRLAGGEG